LLVVEDVTSGFRDLEKQKILANMWKKLLAAWAQFEPQDGPFAPDISTPRIFRSNDAAEQFPLLDEGYVSLEST
jgi:hypothetical protein